LHALIDRPNPGKEAEMRKFIESLGGPLLMLERRLLPYWGGSDNRGGVTSQLSNGAAPGSLSDYDRACETSRLITDLKVHDGLGVVFWGELLDLCLEKENDGVFFAIRPYYVVENFEAHIKFVKENPGMFQREFEILLSTGNAIVFDSVFAGTDLHRDSLEIDVLPGVYEVLTCEYKAPNAETVFHKFRRYRDA
jgi:hypothetical protein